MTYVTRKNVHVDRCASAWLIKRFIDKDAKFVFVEEDELPEGAIAFDMPGAEWGHHGDCCSFETILGVHGLSKDKTLCQIGEIIHGADIVTDFDSTFESPGIDLAFRGLRLVSSSDDEAIQRGAVLMDAIYEAIKQGYRR